MSYSVQKLWVRKTDRQTGVKPLPTRFRDNALIDT